MLRWFLGPTASLSHRVTRAGVWLLVGDGLGRGANFVKLVVLARLLSPGDFGLMGVALVVTSIVEYFTELGLNAALVQRRGDIRPFLDTAWVCQIARSIGLASLVLVAAPLAGRFFGEPAAVAIIRTLAVDIVIRGFVNPGVVFLRRDLQTGREVLWRSAGMLAGLVVGVPAALWLRSVWALVISLVTASSVDMLMSYWVHPYRPRLRLEIDKARELMRFGRWISWFRAVAFATTELPGLVVAKAVGVHPLGQFQMARQLGVLPTVTLGTHVHGVMFPALASLTSHDQRRRAFLRALSALSTVTVAFAAVITVFGPWLIEVGLGPQWTGTATPLQILVWAGCVRALTLLNNALIMAMGRPRLDFQATMPNAVILTTLLYPAGLKFGIVGVSLVVAVGAIVTYACQLTILHRHAGIEFRVLARALWGGALASLPIFGVVILPEQGAAATVVVAMIATLVSVVLLVKSLQMSLRGSVADIGVKG